MVPPTRRRLLRTVTAATAAVFDVDSGAYRTVEQGSERRPFDAGDCP